MKNSKFNVHAILFNLLEAKEELEEIIALMEDESDEDVLDEDLKWMFMHAYHHINSAWHVRNARPSYMATFTDQEFHVDAQFPNMDFIELGFGPTGPDDSGV